MRLLFSEPRALLLLFLVPLLVLLGVRALSRTRRSGFIIGLRSVAVVLLILALAGSALGLPERDLSVVFLVDASDSLGSTGRTGAVDWVRESYESAGGADKAGLVLFGKEPLVEQDVGAPGDLSQLLSRPDATATDIPAAIRLAIALFPEGTQKRIVLVSDGNNNVGDIEEAARLAETAGVQIQTHTLGAELQGDVLVESVQAPPRVRAGEGFEIEVTVRSTEARSGTLEVLGDGRVIAQRPVDLEPGANSFVVAVGKQARGFRRWRARVIAGGDTVAQNNQGDGFTYVESPPRVLVAEGEAGEGRNLRAALKATDLDATLINVSALPTSLTALSEYSAVVLVDVPLAALPDQGKLLQTYVRDLGRGLVAVGGEDSYALGNYFDSPLEATLPLDSRLKNKREEPAVAMVMVIDKSGSMAASHTGEGPDGSFQAPGSAPKVDVAKAAAIQSAELLGPDDEFGVVAFDTAARWVVRTAPLTDKADVSNRVAGIQGGGGTNIYSGLAEAIESLKSSKASIKHVILLTDGWSNVGDYDKLLGEARANGITVSTVSAAGGSPELLRSVAQKGNGTFYVANNNADIPKIFVKETKTRLRRYIQEKEFVPTITAPSPVLKGLTSVPSLLGYVGTTPKSTASVALSSTERDPVLAQWQYGLGRSVAWTSDAKARWSRNWIGTQEYARLWSQSVGWVLARPSENLQVQIAHANGEATVEVDALRPDGAYLNGARATVGVVSPSGKVTEAPLTQTAPGRYVAKVPASEPGSYITSVSLAGAGQVTQAPTTGFAVGYSPEYRALGPNKAALAGVARTTGGREIAPPEEAWTHDLAAVLSTRSLTWPLMLFALLLLPVEVAFRRLKLGALPVPPAVVRRRAATSQTTSSVAPSTSGETVRSPLAEAAPVFEPVTPTPDEPQEDDALTRLRSAKRRAGKRYQ